MAHVLAVNDVLRVRWVHQQGAQMAVNVRHYVVTSTTGTSATDADAASRFNTLTAALFKALMTVNSVYRGVGVQVIDPGPPFVEQTDITSAGGGTVVGDALPPQVAGLIKFTTAFAGRSGRGFMYPPFPGEADNGAGAIPAAGYVTNLTALKNAMIATVTVGVLPNTATLTPILWNGALAAARTVNGGVARAFWSQQKRRSFLRKGDVFPF
jgi:hypothetical protein